MSKEQVLEVIRRTLDLELDSTDVAGDCKLKDLGIDSLALFNVLVELEALTGRQLEDENVSNIHTLNDLVAYFYS